MAGFVHINPTFSAFFLWAPLTSIVFFYCGSQWCQTTERNSYRFATTWGWV